MRRTVDRLGGLWRMTHLGEWLSIRCAVGREAASLEQFSEFFASMCVEHLGDGDVITAEFGARALTVRGDARGVLLGVHDVDVNPLMIRTLMTRLEQTSTCSVATTSLRMSDDPIEEVEPFEVAEDFQSVDFDNIFGSADSELDSFADEDVGVGCTWGQVASFVEQSITATSAMLGRTIAANYWREALSRRDSFSPPLKVNPRGAVQIVGEKSSSMCTDAEHLEEAWAYFLARCARVLPTLEGLKSDTGAAPWARVPTPEAQT
ncbi:MAG: hypothetical protein AAGI01_01585 [Myxococcota bacterium]